MHSIRSRSGWWLAAVLAVVLTAMWATAAWQVDAAPTADESTIVNVPPERVLDTRDPNNIGLFGPFISPAPQKLKVTGLIATATGMKTVVPDGATGVLLNVTSINSTADGFISVRPGDATGAPTTSSLNFTAGSTVPNAVQVALPTTGPNAGQIDITYDALGQSGPTADIFVDVVGYTKNTGLMDLINEKANVADVYTKDETDTKYIAHGDIELGYAPIFVSNWGDPVSVRPAKNLTQLAGGTGVAQLSLTGPNVLGRTSYGLKSVTYCVQGLTGPSFVTSAAVESFGPQPSDYTEVLDGTDRTTAGCYTVTVNSSSGTSHMLAIEAGGGGGVISIRSVTAIWSPDTALS